MSIPHTIKIKRHPSPGLRPPSPRGRGKGEGLPTTPGVYLFKDGKGKVVYVGKATNLKSRVSSYWKTSDGHGLKTGWPRITDGGHSAIRANRRMGRTIDEMLYEVARIDWIVTDSVIEALILEANLIRKYMPKYNVREKDDKSFLYVGITREQFPKVILVRGAELPDIRYSKLDIRKQKYPISNIQYQKIFGPYTSASSIRAALDLIRKWFPWSMCQELKMKNEELRIKNPRPCFDYHIGRCPGVCIGAITRREYMKNIRNVILMLSGKKARAMKNVEQEMKRAATEERFEEAEVLRRKLFALRHIRDVAVIAREPNYESVRILRSTNSSIRNIRVHSPFASQHAEAINVLGRVEGYDISNISGTSAVGSMVVFEDGEPKKSEYKRFRIKGVSGINDVAMMREVLLRRFKHINIKSWGAPDLLVVDGGWGQVNAAREVLSESATKRRESRLLVAEIPVIGIAKGFKRKQDRPVFDKENPELARIVENYKDLLLRVRDEAHRFAVAYHREVMRKR